MATTKAAPTSDEVAQTLARFASRVILTQSWTACPPTWPASDAGLIALATAAMLNLYQFT